MIVQTRLPEEKIERLKMKTGKETIKEALSEAVYHYLYCPLARKIDEEIERTKRGRKPLYLKKKIEAHVPNEG